MQNQIPTQQVNPDYQRRSLPRLTVISAKAKKLISFSKFIVCRLTGVFLADFILTNTHIITEYIDSKLVNFLPSFFVFFASKFFFLIQIVICLFLFMSRPNSLFRLFKLVGLASQPFIFTFLINLSLKMDLVIDSTKIPRIVLVLIVYSINIFLTYFFYKEIYYDFIIDKYEIYRFYQLYKSQNEESHFVELLTDNGYKNIRNVVHNDHQVHNRISELQNFLELTDDYFNQKNRIRCNKRMLYMIGYSFLAFILNDVILLPENDERLNIISIGYLSLLFYDLTINLDQMLLRFLLRLKIFGRIITQGQSSNFIFDAWYNRFKVPLILKLYFLVKIAIFTLNFTHHIEYYYDLNDKISYVKTPKTKSLFNYVLSIFVKNQESYDSDTENEKILFSNIWSQFLSLFYTYDFNFHIREIDIVTIFKIYLKFLILNQTASFISILCTSVAISYKFRLVGIFLKKLIQNDEVSNVSADFPDLKNIGEISGCLFFILSLQSSITSLSGTERIEKFYRNYSLLFIAVLHFFHTSVDFQLNRLVSSNETNTNENRKKRRKILIVSTFLIIIPILIITFIWKYFSLSTWLLTATAFNIELIIKMLVSVIIFFLYVYDEKNMSHLETMNKKDDDLYDVSEEEFGIHDKFDDYIYYIRGISHVCEFIVAIFLFFNGAYILMFESYGSIRAFMTCLHAYFHIWCKALNGWFSFIKRRKAIKNFKNFPKFNRKTYINLMIKKFPMKTEQILGEEFEEKKSDKCGICMENIVIKGAIIVKCNHVFHYRCVRRWFYEHETCPLCKQYAFMDQTG